MLAATMVKMTGSEKKCKHFLHKTCNREVSGSFTYVVVVQNSSKEMYKKSVQSCFLLIRKKVCCTCKVFFWLIGPTDFCLAVFVAFAAWRYMILYFVK